MSSCYADDMIDDPSSRDHATGALSESDVASDGDLTTVLETADAALLPVVTSLLDGAGIPYFVQGDRAMGLMPLGPFSASFFGRALAARVRVPSEYAAEAEALLSAEPIETLESDD